MFRIIVTLLAVTTVATTAGCAEDSDGSATTGSSAADAPAVLATTTVWADIARNVGCDGLVDVDTIMPAGSDPHAFEPSLRDRERMGQAAVIVANGLGLEESLDEVIDTVAADGVTVVRAGDHVTVLAGDAHDGEDENEQEEEHDDHDHTGADPHIWLDPNRVREALPAIGDAFVAAGADPTAIDECVTSYDAELVELDDQLTASVAALPADRRLLVTNHDALSYFADRYDFEIVGTVIPSSSSLAATNPAELEELARAVETAGVPAIFAETQHSSDDTEALAARVGDVTVVTLRTDTLGEPDSDSSTYVDWMTTTTQQIVDALA